MAERGIPLGSPVTLGSGPESALSVRRRDRCCLQESSHGPQVESQFGTWNQQARKSEPGEIVVAPGPVQISLPVIPSRLQVQAWKEQNSSLAFRGLFHLIQEVSPGVGLFRDHALLQARGICFTLPWDCLESDLTSVFIPDGPRCLVPREGFLMSAQSLRRRKTLGRSRGS